MTRPAGALTLEDLMSRVRVLGFFAAGSLLPTAAQAAWETKQLATMSVEVYTPASQSPIGSGRALMIALHGCSQTGQQLRQYGNFEAAAEDFGMVVALPTVPGGGVVAGCWNYYGAIHTRESGHNKPVLDLAAALQGDAAYGIDPAQVYLTGFSSGGGQAVVLGCLAPDVFAGVVISAGPSVGTSISQIGSVGTTAAQAATLCQSFAGSHAGDFATQLAIAFTDTGDFTVAQGYAQVNADMFASIYGGGAMLTASALDVASMPGSNPTGTATAYADAEGERIALVTSMSGVGHAWPSGSGMNAGGLTFVSGNGLNLSYFAAETFTANSRRAEGEWNPGTGGGSDGGADGTGGGSDGGGDNGDTDGGAEGGSAGEGGGDAGSGDGADDAAGEDGIGGSDSAGATPIEPSGCQCHADDGRTIAPLGLVVAVALGRRRRRVDR